MNEFACAAVLLAAGASSRMGKAKLLLPWEGTSILGHLLRQWRLAGTAQIGVVHAPPPGEVPAELDRLGFPAAERILNTHPAEGMFSSIQCAARWPGWKPGLTHWAIVLGDQPHLRLETLRELLRFAAAHPDAICQPAFQGRPRHPVILPQSIFQQLPRTGAATLQQFLAPLARRLELRPADDPGLDFDIDTPADYQKALGLI